MSPIVVAKPQELAATRVFDAPRSRVLAVVAIAFALGACAGAGAETPSGQTRPSAVPASASAHSAAVGAGNGKDGIAAADAIRAAVSAPDRSADDRALDEGRRPAETLAFFGIAPGMSVAEIAAGFGYTTELVARVVGTTGKVYGENNRFVLEKFAENGWAARLAKPVNKNVVRVDRELDDPLPPEAKDLDAVIDVLFYHDTVWMKTDRAKMNTNIFAALKHGGIYGIVDHSARDGAGVGEVQSLHRIEEKVVRAEIEKAGFTLAAEGDFLRNPKDARDWNASPRAAAERRGTSDRFVLKFVKP